MILIQGKNRNGNRRIEADGNLFNLVKTIKQRRTLLIVIESVKTRDTLLVDIEGDKDFKVMVQ